MRGVWGVSGGCLGVFWEVFKGKNTKSYRKTTPTTSKTITPLTALNPFETFKKGPNPAINPFKGPDERTALQEPDETSRLRQVAALVIGLCGGWLSLRWHCPAERFMPRVGGLGRNNPVRS